MKHPEQMSLEDLKQWALSTGMNPKWIEIFSSYKELLADYTAAYSLGDRVNKQLEVLGYFYNTQEVIGHLTAFNNDNLDSVLALNDSDFEENIENACNIIDLNNDSSEADENEEEE